MITLFMSNDRDGCGKRLTVNRMGHTIYLVSKQLFYWSQFLMNIYKKYKSPVWRDLSTYFFTNFPIILFPSRWPSSYSPWISEQLSIWPFLLPNQIIYSLTCFIKLQRSPNTENDGNLKEYNNFRKYYNYPRIQCFYPECLWKKFTDIYNETFINLFTITYSKLVESKWPLGREWISELHIRISLGNNGNKINL